MKGSLLAGRGVALAQRIWRHVGFAPDDWTDPGTLRRQVELNRAVKIAVIGYCHCGHPTGGCLGNEVFCADCAVQERILRVTMQVVEGDRSHRTSLKQVA